MANNNMSYYDIWLNLANGRIDTPLPAPVPNSPIPTPIWTIIHSFISAIISYAWDYISSVGAIIRSFVRGIVPFIKKHDTDILCFHALFWWLSTFVTASAAFEPSYFAPIPPHW